MEMIVVICLEVYGNFSTESMLFNLETESEDLKIPKCDNNYLHYKSQISLV